jgi:hypothetical protein
VPQNCATKAWLQSDDINPGNEMKSVKATSIREVNDKLHNGESKEVVIDFDISSDDFFALSDYWCERGAKIKKEGDRFKIKLGKTSIPEPPEAKK